MQNIPLVSPYDIISQITPMGNMDLNVIMGNYYVEDNHCLTRAGYNAHCLFFSKWKKPGPLDFIYQPDGYDYLLNGKDAIEFSDGPEELVGEFHIIETKGGLDAYLSRLKSKKRSEFKKLQGRANVGKYVTAICGDTENPISELIDSYLMNTLNEYYEKEAGKSIDDWFGAGFNTNKSPILLMLYAGHYAVDMIRKGMTRILLPIVDEKGENICVTMCLADHHGKVLYALSDETKVEGKYSAKEVTVANIEWACANGYEYVDIDNGFVSEHTVADPSDLVRVAYKNLFWTGVASVPRYFSSERAMRDHFTIVDDEDSDE